MNGNRATSLTFASRCLIAGCLLVLYGAGASWFIRREAHAYRETLASNPRRVRAEILARAEPETAPLVEPTRPIEVSEDRPAAPSSSTPTSLTVDPRPVVASVEPEVSRNAASLHDLTGAKPPEHVTELKATADGDPSIEKSEPGLEPAPIWESPAVKKLWDIKSVTAQDESQIGQILHSVILETNPPVKGGPWAGRLQEAMEALQKTETVKQSRYTYTISVLESDAFNAFSHPGGYIYVSRNLIDSFGQDESAALEFLLAHEMAHVENHDALLCLQSRDLEILAEQEKLGTVELLYFLVIPLAYPQDMEYAADEWALQRMAELGHTRLDSLDFLRKLEQKAENEEFSQGKVRPDPTNNPLDNHIRAHISARSRLNHAKEFWDAHPAPIR